MPQNHGFYFFWYNYQKWNILWYNLLIYRTLGTRRTRCNFPTRRRLSPCFECNDRVFKVVLQWSYCLIRLVTTSETDLTLLESFLWETLKDNIFKHTPSRIEELKRLIKREIQNISTAIRRTYFETFSGGFSHVKMCWERIFSIFCNKYN